MEPDEFGLIDTFVSQFDVAAAPQGPGDDCAVLFEQGSSCVTTDAVVEGVHFTRNTFSFADVGHKALAVNLSDIAAMGAKPSWFTVALGVPSDVSGAAIKELGRGMSHLARIHGARLVGGNVTSSKQLSLTLTVSGTLDGPPLLRSGGQEGDALYVSGPLGNAAAGLMELQEGKRHSSLIRAQRRPSPHVAFGLLARTVCAAAIDVSDGLAQDLGHLCRASNVGADVDSASLPMTRALVRFAGSKSQTLALTGGEDYVLLVAVRGRTQFETEMARAGFAAHHIGWLRRGSGVRLDGVMLEGKLGFKHR